MDISGANITIAGAGRTARSLAALLLEKGAVPFVSESASAESCADAAMELKALGVEAEFGTHSEERFTHTDIVIPSPGVSPKRSPISLSIEGGVPVLGEMEMASRFITSKILAVTGTNGKTTTTEWLGAVLNANGRKCLVVGNNDTPLSKVALLNDQPEYLVVEVSSYQLETMAEFHPISAAVLNLTPDHLTRHDTMDEYASVKARIFSNQSDGDTAIFNSDDEYVSSMSVPEGVTQSCFGFYNASANWSVENDWILFNQQPFLETDSIPLPGNHNLYNAMAVLALGSSVGIDAISLRTSIQDFTGVEHRIERVAEWGGVVYFNDSKSTNLDSLKVALESFSSPIVLLAGGEGKGTDYCVLNSQIEEHVKTVLAFGEDAALIKKSWEGSTRVQVVDEMREALQKADAAADSGDVVLLSPACGSFDQFKNFEERGTYFKRLVRDLIESKSEGKQYA